MDTERSDHDAESEPLLLAVKSRLDELTALLETVSSHWHAEDKFYRFYHQSWKLYGLQRDTLEIVEALRSLWPEKQIHPWFEKRPRYHLHFTPTSSSWLNQVERWFAKITEQRIRRGVFKSVDELIAAIDDYVVANHRSPQPFAWTASADLILERVGKLCKRTNRSPH